MLLQKPPKNISYEIFFLYEYLHENSGIRLRNYMHEVVVDKNEYVYRPPNNNNYIYEIVEGAVKLGSYSEHGEEHVYDVLQKGDIFGNLKYLNNQFFEFSKTLIDTRLRIYELHFFKKTITGDPILADWFISYLLKRWCASEKKLGNISGNTTRERIQFLQFQFNVHLKDAKGSEHLLFDLLTQKDLGDLVGATRQTISTILKKNHSFLSKIPG